MPYTWFVTLVPPLLERNKNADNLLQTGAGTTASRLGMADLAIAQLHDMKEHAEMIANLDPFGPPLIADMDTGYGGKASGSELTVQN